MHKIHRKPLALPLALPLARLLALTLSLPLALPLALPLSLPRGDLIVDALEGRGGVFIGENKKPLSPSVARFLGGVCGRVTGEFFPVTSTRRPSASTTKQFSSWSFPGVAGLERGRDLAVCAASSEFSSSLPTGAEAPECFASLPTGTRVLECFASLPTGPEAEECFSSLPTGPRAVVGERVAAFGSDCAGDPPLGW